MTGLEGESGPERDVMETSTVKLAVAETPKSVEGKRIIPNTQLCFSIFNP